MSHGTTSRVAALERLRSLVEQHPGIDLYRLDRLAAVAQFPDSAYLPDLVDELVARGVVRQSTGPTGGPCYHAD